MMTATQAAKFVGSISGRRPHVSTVIRWIQTNKLPGIRQGGIWLVQQADIVAFLRPAVAAASPPPAVEAARLELERRQLADVLGYAHGPE
jgi:hypothetical protein